MFGGLRPYQPPPPEVFESTPQGRLIAHERRVHEFTKDAMLSLAKSGRFDSAEEMHRIATEMARLAFQVR